MGKGSVLKNLKTDLQKNDLLRNQSQPKKGKEDKFQAQKRRERDQQSLSAIRDAFNPFNMKFNRGKSADGRQKEGGRPVAARSQAEMQRRRTWDAEKRLKNKVGGLVDRRFGEKDKSMSEEDKMVERYAREKLNHMRKANNRKSFNIEQESDEGEDDILTHGGQKLEFNDDFAEDDLGVLDEDDNSIPSSKRAKRNEEDSFGGSAPGDESGEENSEPKNERPKTKAEVMQEVIAKSKLHKLERQQQKARDDELVENLNADFDDLMADLAQVESKSQKEKRETDAYDVNIQEFAFEKRADPKDRTKTDQEIAEEAAEKKRQAERAQQARMDGDELDVDYDNVGDDAGLFGLQDNSDSEEEGVVSDAGSSENENKSEERTANGYAKVNIPETYKDLSKALAGDTDVAARIKSYVKVATPGRGTGSEPQLHNLASSLVTYACNSDNSDNFGSVCGILHDICPKNEVGIVVANKCRDLVHRAHTRPEWTRRELLLFALIGSLFSTSDQWHVVATSASLVITQRLSQSVSPTLGEVNKNLFLCDVLLDYQRLSKRYYPEVSGYLLRVLFMLNPGKNRKVAERLVRIPSIHNPKSNELLLQSPIDPEAQGISQLGNFNAPPTELAIIVAKIASKAAGLWRSLEAFPEIFNPIKVSLENFAGYEQNRVISDAVNRLAKLAHFSSNERKPLQLQDFRPVGIITHAPLFDENYNPEMKGHGLDPERRELQKLKALHKKERKSTMREIRRDTEFESRQQLSDKRREMSAYHDKLKQLEGQINGEEGAERNAYEREKKKRGRN